MVTAAILAVLRDAIREIYLHPMEAVDPNLIDAAEAAALTSGVCEVGAVRLRWIGHQLRAGADIVVPADLTIAVNAEHTLIHAVPRLTAATVHTPNLSADAHQALATTPASGRDR
nr:hypothetical protein [Parafrankia discariae]